MTKMYSVRDVVAGSYSPVVHFKNDALACRWFGMAVNDPKNSLHSVKADVQLFRVGEMDEDTGYILPESPVLVMKGVDLDGESSVEN